MAKKNYNPFKMWGSYLGLIIFILLTWVGCSTAISYMPYLVGQGGVALIGETSIPIGDLSNDVYYGVGMPYFMGTGCNEMKLLDLPDIQNKFTFIYIFIGFLIGWGIHSLVRKFKK